MNPGPGPDPGAAPEAAASGQSQVAPAPQAAAAPAGACDTKPQSGASCWTGFTRSAGSTKRRMRSWPRPSFPPPCSRRATRPAPPSPAPRASPSAAPVRPSAQCEPAPAPATCSRSRTEEAVLLRAAHGNGLGVLPQGEGIGPRVLLPVPRFAAEDPQEEGLRALLQPGRIGQVRRDRLPVGVSPGRPAPAPEPAAGPGTAGGGDCGRLTSAEPRDVAETRPGPRARRGRGPRRTGAALARGARRPRGAAR